MKQSTFRTVLRAIRQKTAVTLMFLLILQATSFAQTQTSILVDPATTNVVLGQSFTAFVRIDVATAGAVSSVQIGLNFDRSKLQVTNITRPSSALFTTEAIALPSDYSVMNGTGAGAGQITYQAAMPAGSTTTDFNILAITFTTTGLGSTPLTFNTTVPRLTRAALGGTVVAGPPANAPINGVVNILSCPTPPQVTIANPPTCNGQAFFLYASGSTAGTGPFDIVVNGVTYNDVTPGPSGSTFLNVVPANEKIWPGNPTPSGPDNNDGMAIETGVKFRSSVAGFVKGVRFYLGSNSAGTYTGKLYTAAGAVQAQRNFTSVTANGWNEITFTTPVAIAANTTYVASVYSSVGNYAQTDFGLTSATTTGNLTALAEGTDGSNGVYNYGNGFPTDTWVGHSPNYWVDVLFTPSTFVYNLTSVTDATGCTNVGSPNLQTLTVNSVDCSTLPVTLLNLSATPENKNVRLRWSTATEIDNKGFEIQRSTNGSTWEGVGYVNGAGNSSVTRNYSYLDEGLFPRRYYYRLKQEDIDGKYKYSMVVAVVLEGKGEFSLGQNYPNPFRTVTTIPYTLAERTQVSLTVYDMNGRVVKVLVNEKRDAGTHAENFHVGGLPAGMYYYKIQAGSFSAVRKLVLN